MRRHCLAFAACFLGLANGASAVESERGPAYSPVASLRLIFDAPLQLAQLFDTSQKTASDPLTTPASPQPSGDDDWAKARREKASAARRAAIEARLDREAEDQHHRMDDMLAQEEKENRRLAALARQTREDEEAQRRRDDAEAQRRVAEQQRIERLAQEQEERRLAEQRQKDKLAQEQDEKRRQADADAVARIRLAEQQLAERQERERLAREEDEKRRQAAAIVAQQRQQLRTALLSEPIASFPVRQEPEAVAPVSTPPPADVSTTPVVGAGGLAADEAFRFTQEERRRARGRIERLRPGDKSDAASSILDSADDRASPVKTDTSIASLAPAPEAPPVPPTSAALDQPEVVQSVQTELKRLGCYAGPLDGVLDQATRESLVKAGQALSPASTLQPVRSDVLMLLKLKQGRLCGEIACRSGQVRKGDACVAAKEPREAEPPKKVKAVAREALAPQRPPADAPARSGAGRSRCFSFNGGQYCE